ncbi:MAG TPA: NADH:flavin oxidoreductase/NADH oxidase [Terriglobales bacterium]
MMSHLFEPLTIRGITFRNRIFVSPMCQYSSVNGHATDWHFVHLGSRAVGGAALVMVEATAVTADGRISPGDMGIWSDDHTEELARIFRFVEEQGAVPGIQLAHAGRKASTAAPWAGGGPLDESQGGWSPIFAPSALPFNNGFQIPVPLDEDGIRSIVRAFAAAARRAFSAGAKVIEIHAAHGYLLHTFLSPLTNHRTDQYGGPFENRIRMLCEVVEAVRKVWPDNLPLFVRISATDYAEGGWDLPQSVQVAKLLKPLGADLIDCSSGGLLPRVKINVGPGYQVPFAEAIRKQAGILTGAVGMITAPVQADQIIRTGQADAVLLARELLRNPYWPLLAAHELRQDATWPQQYLRARP